MAAENAPLVITAKVDAKDVQRGLAAAVRAAEREVAKLKQQMTGIQSDAPRRAARNVDQLRRSAASAGNELRTMAGSLRGIAGTALGAVGAGFSISAVQQLLDANTRITNSLKVAGLEGDRLTQTYSRLAQIAKENGASFESLVSLYSRVTQSSKELGVSTQQIEEFVRRMAVGLRASGTSSEQASDGIRQLTQALASGLLRGDEFNSVMENLPVVAKAIASGLGVTTGELRKMAEAGQLTAKTVFDAFIQGSADFDAQAAKTQKTISGSMASLTTALIEAAGKFDAATKSSEAFAKFIGEDLPRVIDESLPLLIKGANLVGSAWAEIGDVMDEVLRASERVGQATGLSKVGEAFGATPYSQTQEPGTGVVAGRAEADAIRARQEAARSADRQTDAVRQTQSAYRDLATAVVNSTLSVDNLVQTTSRLDPDKADALEQSFAKVKEELGSGKINADDFADTIAKLRDTGDATGAALADSLQGYYDLLVDSAKQIDATDLRAQALAQTIAEGLKDALTDVRGIIDEMPAAMQPWIAAFQTAIEKAGELKSATGDAVPPSLGGIGPGGGGPLVDIQNDRRLRESLGSAADAIDSFVERVIQAEAPQGGPNRAGASSAQGYGQFLKSTWLDVFKRNFASEASGMSDAAILALRDDLETNRRMIRAYATENARDLIGAGQQVTEASLQLAHFLGSGGAIKILQAAPGTRVSAIPGMGAAIAANPSILGGGATREDVLAYANRRARATPERASRADYAEQIAQMEKDIALRRELNDINGNLALSEDERATALDRANAAAEQAKIEEELLNAAKAQGLAITPELIAKNRELAAEYVNLGLSGKALQQQQENSVEAQRRQAAAMEEFYGQIGGIAKSAIGGFISDLRNGVDAGEAFNNMLNRIIDSLINMALEAAFSTENMKALFGGLGGTSTGGGSWISSLLGIGGGGGSLITNVPSIWGAGFKKGGVVGRDGEPTGLHPLSLWRGAPSYQRGGMVGVPPGAVPIFAHPGEIIVPRTGARSGSGYVDNSRTTMGDVNIDMAGSGYVAADNQSQKQFGENVRRLVLAEMVRESRPGGLLRRTSQ